MHLREELEKLMDELNQARKIRQLKENDDMNSWFINHVATSH